MLQYLLPQGQHRDGPQAHLEPVGQRGFLIHTEMLHLPHMGELVAGTRRGTRRDAVLLHRQTGHHKTLDEAVECLRLSIRKALRVTDRASQRTLDEIPHLLVNRLDTQLVSDDPVGSGRDLLDEVTQSGGGAALGRTSHHRQIGNEGLGGATTHGVFKTVLGDGGAEGGISIHRCGRADVHVAPPQLVTGSLGEVIEGARTDGTGNHPVEVTDVVTDLLDVLVAGVNGGTSREDHRLDGLNPVGLEGRLGLLTGNGPGVLVGNDDRLRATEQFLEHAPGLIKHVVTHDHDVSVVAISQCLVNQFGHYFSSDRCDRQFLSAS